MTNLVNHKIPLYIKIIQKEKKAAIIITRNYTEFLFLADR